MGFRLYRLDASYSAVLLPPALSLVGKVPEAIKTLYEAFAERYPGIKPDAFKATNPATLAEVGVGVSLMGGRFELVIRVDQITGQATNLQTPEEVRFAQDCATLAHTVARKLSEGTLGDTTMRLSAWLIVDGGPRVIDTLLSAVATPAAITLDGKSVGADTVSYQPRVELSNDQEGWRVTVMAERSAIQAADLFLVRNYAFAGGKKLAGFEQQMAFIDSSTAAIVDWLGIGPLNQ